MPTQGPRSRPSEVRSGRRPPCPLLRRGTLRRCTNDRERRPALDAARFEHFLLRVPFGLFLLLLDSAAFARRRAARRPVPIVVVVVLRLRHRRVPVFLVLVVTLGGAARGCPAPFAPSQDPALRRLARVVRFLLVVRLGRRGRSTAPASPALFSSGGAETPRNASGRLRRRPRDRCGRRLRRRPWTRGRGGRGAGVAVLLAAGGAWTGGAKKARQRSEMLGRSRSSAWSSCEVNGRRTSNCGTTQTCGFAGAAQAVGLSSRMTQRAVRCARSAAATSPGSRFDPGARSTTTVTSSAPRQPWSASPVEASVAASCAASAATASTPMRFAVTTRTVAPQARNAASSARVPLRTQSTWRAGVAAAAGARDRSVERHDALANRLEVRRHLGLGQRGTTCRRGPGARRAGAGAARQPRRRRVARACTPSSREARRTPATARAARPPARRPSG